MGDHRYDLRTRLRALWSTLRIAMAPLHGAMLPARRPVEPQPDIPHHAVAHALPAPQPQERLPMSSTTPSPSPSPAPSSPGSGTAGSAPPSPSPAPSGPTAGSDPTQDERFMPILQAVLTGSFTNPTARPAVLASQAVETAKIVLKELDDGGDDADDQAAEVRRPGAHVQEPMPLTAEEKARALEEDADALNGQDKNDKDALPPVADPEVGIAAEQRRKAAEKAKGQ